MLAALREQVRGSWLEAPLRRALSIVRPRFVGSKDYWQRRYAIGGDSGAGSLGHLARFKAQEVQLFMEDHDVSSVIEFGCGDGLQLQWAAYSTYTGVDVSKDAINKCQKMFFDRPRWAFLEQDSYSGEKADLALSLDVIYHLVEDRVYHEYMNQLFDAALRFVGIYSSNWDFSPPAVAHVRHRQFTKWISDNRPDFEMVRCVSNPYPYDPLVPARTSPSDFYFFARVGEEERTRKGNQYKQIKGDEYVPSELSAM